MFYSQFTTIEQVVTAFNLSILDRPQLFQWLQPIALINSSRNLIYPFMAQSQPEPTGDSSV